MSVTCGTITAWLESWAPLNTAEAWDNSGLQVGDPGQGVRKVLLALDATEAVVQEAIETDAQMIISHHPLLFRPWKQLRTDTPEGKLLAKIVRGGLCVYSAHTNLDVAEDGVNDALAAKLGLESVEPLRTQNETLLKIVVFVPLEHVDNVWAAMAAAGAGHIGNYSHCGFQTEGRGTFLPLAGTQPFTGEAGRLSTVRETRLETVVTKQGALKVLQAMRESHPYEEVAYDLVPLQNTVVRGGLGRLGVLPEKMALDTFVAQVKQRLATKQIRRIGAPGRQISRVAVCGGAGSELVADAVKAGADVLVTGDVKYHDAQAAASHGLCLVDAGHFATEVPMLDVLRDRLREHASCAGWDCVFEIAKAQEDVFSSFF